MRTSWARPRAGCQHMPTGRESRIPGSPEKPDPKEHHGGTSSATAARIEYKALLAGGRSLLPGALNDRTT